ncbi:OTU-like cysteine protease [Musa troglodytarum]|uniref:OTU-like cysteine protease n=1 Tax=Musa troglodytarum TaxID=320322 RepID=A0A9E7HXS7_9LILI|nr:OTU-like cysteine protease [Musa troglodytarum]
MFEFEVPESLKRLLGNCNSVLLMIMYEQDPDLVRWGLHLLLEPPSNSTYCATSSHSSTDDSGLHCADETGSWEARDSVENDEVIAHALQEELSQIAMVEASGPSLVTEEPLQESVLTQNWLASSTTIVCLSFWAEVHYNSIYPEGELPVLEVRNKKRWWHFGF